MPVGTFNANIYPVTGPHDGTAPPRLGLCLSGGGSRALSCALGQLSALRTIPDPRTPGQSVLEGSEWISSVSGGSWAATLYTYLPQTINGQPVSDDDFLISPQPPSALKHEDPSVKDPANVAYLAPYCMGNAPTHFSAREIGQVIYKLYEWGLFGLFDASAKRPWWWIAAVGELIFKPFGLYNGIYDPNVDYIQPVRSFSLSADYVIAKIQNNNPSVTPSQFYLARPNRPELIVNTNILQNLDDPKSAQVPVQGTSTWTSVPGRSPDGTLVGGGGVESFAFTSTLFNKGGNPKLVGVTTNRNYSLCDISGCSSAAFATLMLPYLNNILTTDILPEIEAYLQKEGFSQAEIDVIVQAIKWGWSDFLDPSVANVTPQYNYWPLGATSAANNQTYGFSDGGDFDDTAILGLLAQTDANRIIACVNSEEPLVKSGNTIVVSAQIALLFGYEIVKQGTSVSYREMLPSNPLRYVKVFSDQKGEFAALCQGLYNASCGGPNRDSQLGTYTSAYLQTLTTVDNPVANIKGGRQVKVLWMNNFLVMNWQRQIADEHIQVDLALGQSKNPTGPLANFPLYATVEQLDLDAEGVNMLAQLSAWNLDQAQVLIRQLLK